MKYDNEFVNRVVGTIASGRCSIRGASRLLGVSRNTISTWVSRVLGGIPARMSRAAKRVWNRPSRKLLARLRKILSSGASSVKAWVAVGKRMSIRAVQRWKAKWSPKKRERKSCKRYERRKALSLMHTDWGAKRIGGGKRMCFTFHEDDATRRLYVLRAYDRADQKNTLDNLCRAIRESGGFKSVLTDCGRVYTKTYGEACKSWGVRNVHTRPYNPKCNGKAEAVVKKIKAFLKRHHVRDIRHANQLLGKFQREYNGTPHSSLRYMTPMETYRVKRRAGYIWGVT